MRISFFKRSAPRGFNYKPRYYDPDKEAREQRRRELLGDDARADTQDTGEYVPGQLIRSRGIRRSRTGITSRLAERKNFSTTRAVLMLLGLGLILWWLLA